MENDPKGLQNLLEFLWDYIRDLARTQIEKNLSIFLMRMLNFLNP